MSVKASSVPTQVKRRILTFPASVGILIVLISILTPEYVYANGIHKNAVEVFNGQTVSYQLRGVTIPEVGVTHFSINIKPLPLDRVTHPIEIIGTAQNANQEDFRFESTGLSVLPQPPYIYSIDFPIPTPGLWLIKFDIKELDEREFVEFEVELFEPAEVRWWLIIVVILVILGMIGIVSKRMAITNERQ